MQTLTKLIKKRNIVQVASYKQQTIKGKEQLLQQVDCFKFIAADFRHEAQPNRNKIQPSSNAETDVKSKVLDRALQAQDRFGLQKCK